MPSLFLTVILFSYIKDHVLTNKRLAVLLTFLLILSTLESWLFQNVVPPIPWNADVVMIMLFYYGIGYLFKKTNCDEGAENTRIKVTIVLFISAAVLFLYHTNEIYMYDMKKVIYKNLLLNVLLPFSGFFFIRWCAALIEKQKLISSIAELVGQNTITIMFFHIPVNAVLSSRLTYPVFFYVLVGITVPLILKKVCTLIAEWFGLGYIQKVIRIM